MEALKDSNIKEELYNPKRNFDDLYSKKRNFDSRGSYFSLKRVKQQAQFLDAAADGLDPNLKMLTVLKGLSFHIASYTDPTLAELRSMIVELGGIYEPYYVPGLVSHLVTCRRPNVAGNQFQNTILVHPDWIVACHKAKLLLDYRKYLVVSVDDTGQKSLLKLFQLKSPDLVVSDEFMKLYGKNKTIFSLNENPREFIRDYFSESRLHHLSTWKQELMTNCLRRFFKSEENFSTLKSQWNISKSNVIAHVDIDSFFAQVSLKKYPPEMTLMPVAVCHASSLFSEKSNSTSEISSCNYIARTFGVQNGMRVVEAKKYCPSLELIEYDFVAYQKFSNRFYDFLIELSWKSNWILVPISVDEVYIGILGSDPQTLDFALLRQKILDHVGLYVSIGYSRMGISFSRIATNFAKIFKNSANPGVFEIAKENLSILSELAISNIPSIGRTLSRALLTRYSVETWSHLKSLSPNDLISVLGSTTGKEISALVHELRSIKNLFDFLPDNLYNKPNSTVGCEINWGLRFFNENSLKNFISSLWDALMERIRDKFQPPAKLKLKALIRKKDAPIEPPYKYLGCGSVESHSKTGSVLINFQADVPVRSMLDWCLSLPNSSIENIRGLGFSLEPMIRDEAQPILNFTTSVIPSEGQLVPKIVERFTQFEQKLSEKALKKSIRAQSVKPKLTTSGSYITLTQAWKSTKSFSRGNAKKREIVIDLEPDSKITSILAPILQLKDPEEIRDLLYNWKETFDTPSTEDWNLLVSFCNCRPLGKIIWLLKWLEIHIPSLYIRLNDFVKKDVFPNFASFDLYL